MIKQIEVDERRVLDDAEVIKLIQRGNQTKEKRQFLNIELLQEMI